MLSNKEISKRVLEFQTTDNIDIANDLLIELEPFLKYMCTPFVKSTRMQKDVLINTARIAMFKAMKKYDVTREASFLTYCRYVIYNDILNDLKSLNIVRRTAKNKTTCTSLEEFDEYTFCDNDGYDKKNAIEDVCEILSNLGEEDAELIRLHYGIDGERLNLIKLSEYTGMSYISTRKKVEDLKDMIRKNFYQHE